VSCCWSCWAQHLPAALIDQAVHQAARSVAPLQDQLAQQIARAVILHVDETPWPARALVLWLWVFCCSHTVLCVIGRRTQEMFDNTLSVDFVGRLTSDGHIVYRNWLLRPRCWAHLQRKLRGLAESSDRHTAQAGIAMLDSFDRLMAAILEARERLAQPPPGQADPPAALPLTNNGAERQLRHYGKSAPHQLRHPHARGLQQHGAAGQRHRHLPPARGQRHGLDGPRHPRRPHPACHPSRRICCGAPLWPGLDGGAI
jgi:hypothetical protein